MSNLIYACWRTPEAAIASENLRAAAELIRPERLRDHVPQVIAGAQALLCLTGPRGAAQSEGLSAHLGAFAGSWPQWHRPGTEVPDGTFALLREDPDTVEACSDFAGSRTLWYAFEEGRLLVSTSQRALIALLGGFQLNRAAAAWLLSSGSLGPSDAWDLRLRRLPRGGRLVLDRRAWTLKVHEAPLTFQPRARAAEACQRELGEVLQQALRSYDFGSARWAFPLSGGYDCRFILTTLVEGGLRPPTITWGLAESLHKHGNDAFVAKQLAEHYGLPHDYLLTDVSDEGPAAVIDAFLVASGGATDQLFPYLDGMRLWGALPGCGIDGIIRGDEGFGWIPVKNDQHARTSVGMMLLSDFMDEASAEAIAGGPQRVPAHLERRPEESLATYRDRLYHGFRIPVGLAALNDVKAPFVEIASPLLSRPVLAFVREMPDDLRTDKVLFRRLATSLSPAIPYATMGADDDRNDFLRAGAYPTWMHSELGSGVAGRLFPTAFLEPLLADLAKSGAMLVPRRSLRSWLKRIIPGSWVKSVRAQMGPILPSPRLLALRAALASRFVAMLEADAVRMRR